MAQVSLNSILCIIIIYYHSVNGISYGVAQSDHIKRRPLYKETIFVCLQIIKLKVEMPLVSVPIKTFKANQDKILNKT
jgi:hypothetical protein